MTIIDQHNNVSRQNALNAILQELNVYIKTGFKAAALCLLLLK